MSRSGDPDVVMVMGKRSGAKSKEEQLLSASLHAATHIAERIPDSKRFLVVDDRAGDDLN